MGKGASSKQRGSGSKASWRLLPPAVAAVAAVGIGMLLAFTGLRNLGIITFDSATLITLGGCPANQRNYLYAFDHRLTTEDLATASLQSLPIPATVYGCIGEDVSPSSTQRYPY